MRNIAVVLLVLGALAGCKSKDPTPPSPPNSVEVSAKDTKNYPAMIMLMVGGVASEGEKDKLDFDEDLRLFQTNASAADVLSFYSQELKDRGWTVDSGPAAKSSELGVVIESYHLRDGQAVVLLIAEPEDVSSADLTKSKRYVALMRGKKKPK